MSTERQFRAAVWRPNKARKSTELIKTSFELAPAWSRTDYATHHPKNVVPLLDEFDAVISYAGDSVHLGRLGIQSGSLITAARESIGMPTLVLMGVSMGVERSITEELERMGADIRNPFVPNAATLISEWLIDSQP